MNFIKRAKEQLQTSLGTLPYPVQYHKQQPFIFIHINKTGGTSIGNAVGLPVKSHQTAKQVIKRIGLQDWDTAFKFTFVRNPWDRTASLFKYRKKKNRTKIDSHNLSFDEWIEKTIGHAQSRSYYDNPKSFQPQVDWLKDQQGNISIDVIGRFEQLETDFGKICKELDMQAQLPHLNASSSAPYQSFYSKQSRETVAQWFAEDIETFNYRFES